MQKHLNTLKPRAAGLGLFWLVVNGLFCFVLMAYVVDFVLVRAGLGMLVTPLLGVLGTARFDKWSRHETSVTGQSLVW